MSGLQEEEGLWVVWGGLFITSATSCVIDGIGEQQHFLAQENSPNFFFWGDISCDTNR